jgi:hypothetical protein
VGYPPDPCYGPTETLTVLLVTLPTEAVTATVPLVVTPDTSESTPPVIVANVEGTAFHVATAVMSAEPLHVVASAVKVSLVLLFAKLRGVALVGDILIDSMQPTVTVTDCVPVIEGF